MKQLCSVGQGYAIQLAFFCDGGDVRFTLGSAFLESRHEKVYYFYPVTNAATMGLSPEDTFVKKTGHDPIIVNFDKKLLIGLMFRIYLWGKGTVGHRVVQELPRVAAPAQPHQ